MIVLLSVHLQIATLSAQKLIYYYYFFIRLSVIFFQQFQEVISSFLESIVGMKTLIVSLITILSQVICLFSLVTFNITQF